MIVAILLALSTSVGCWRYEQQLEAAAPSAGLSFGSDLSEMLSFPSGVLQFATIDHSSATVLTNGRSYHDWDQRRFDLLHPGGGAHRVREVAMSATVLAAGAASDDANGTVFAIRLDVQSPVPQVLPPPPGVPPSSGFGTVVAAACLSSSVVAGLPIADAVAVYSGATTMALSAVLRAPQGTAADVRFGAAVAMSDAVIVVGAPAEGHSGYGQVFTYRFDPLSGNWTLATTLIDTKQQQPLFGSGIDIDCSSELLAVACPAHNSSFTHRVLTYRWLATDPSPRWALIDDLADPQPSLNSRFGASIAIDTKSSIAVGAPGADASTKGHVYIFDGPHVLATIGHAEGDWSFGSAITLHDDVLVTGAPGQVIRSLDSAGALFMFSVRELSAVTLAIILSGTLIVVVSTVLVILSCYKLHPSSVIALSRAAKV